MISGFQAPYANISVFWYQRQVSRFQNASITMHTASGNRKTLTEHTFFTFFVISSVDRVDQRVIVAKKKHRNVGANSNYRTQ